MNDRIIVEVKDKFNADIPSVRSGEHLWTMLAMWRVENPAALDTVFLDRENLLTITGVGCYYCEEPYSARLAFRKCKPVSG